MSAIDVERIRLAAGCDTLRVTAVDETGSTNDDLMEAAFGDAPAPPRLLATASQTAGRGRRGRSWITEPGRAIAFSIAFERAVGAQPPPAALPIAVGAAAASALTPWAPDVALKWPNDLQRAGRKLGGILVETRRSPPVPRAAQGSIERIVVGIGVNLVAPKDGAAMAVPACGLFDDSLSRDAPESVIGCIAAAVVPATECFLAHGLAPFIAEWQRFDALAGEAVTATDGDRTIVAGRALGIDATGGLRVQTPSGLRVLNAGEVTVRRVQPPVDAR